MTWTTTKTMVTVGIAALAVVATVVKLHCFPAVKDAYFEPDSDKLRKLPANLVVVRPTRFPRAIGKVRHVHDGDSLARTLGRNVSLRTAIAEAYDCSPAQVVLPPDAPKGGFDFLVTTPGRPRELLRSAIREKTGYTAHPETRDTEVLKLKVENPGLPGLTVSADDEKTDINFKNGKLYFQHQPLKIVLDGLQDGLSQPLLDQTDLTNYYDFSVVWNRNIAQAMHQRAFDLNGVQKVVRSWGLVLEPDTVTMDLFVVGKAR